MDPPPPDPADEAFDVAAGRAEVAVAEVSTGATTAADDDVFDF